MKLTFGKYKNKKIEEVFKDDKRYFMWLSNQELTSKKLRETINNLLLKERMKFSTETFITFGKYKGKTLAELIESDYSYSLWIIENTKDEDLGDELKDLISNNYKIISSIESEYQISGESFDVVEIEGYEYLYTTKRWCDGFYDIYKIYRKISDDDKLPF